VKANIPKGGEKVKERAKRVLTSAAVIFFLMALVTPVISASDNACSNRIIKIATVSSPDYGTQVIEPAPDSADYDTQEKSQLEGDKNQEDISPEERTVETLQPQEQEDPVEAGESPPEGEKSQENSTPEEVPEVTPPEQEDPAEPEILDLEKPDTKGNGNAYAKGHLRKLFKDI